MDIHLSSAIIIPVAAGSQTFTSCSLTQQVWTHLSATIKPSKQVGPGEYLKSRATDRVNRLSTIGIFKRLVFTFTYCDRHKYMPSDNFHANKGLDPASKATAAKKGE